MVPVLSTISRVALATRVILARIANLARVPTTAMVMVTAPRQVCVFAHRDGKVMTAPLQTARAIASDMELVPLANVFVTTATLVLTAPNQDVLPTAPTMACALKASANA